MKAPLSWIKEFIPINISENSLSTILTDAGLEVEHIEHKDFSFEGVIVGKVIETKPHPDAQNLCIATVSDGQQNFQVVCGAPNCRKDLVTAFAPIGSALDIHSEKPFKIKKAKLRGIESYGMLCSGEELGLSSDNDGIMELDQSFKVGNNIQSYFDDPILDISLTPNLGHCFSILGLAREIKAFTNEEINLPQIHFEEDPEQSTEDNISVTIDSDAPCEQYSCRYLYDIQNSSTPSWMAKRLQQCGLKSTSLIVDTVNYVMLEMGQPMHAFDFDRLIAKKIGVKTTEKEISFTCLDGKKVTVPTGTLMIYDENTPIAIAGIMGGANTATVDTTHSILLEAAHFDGKKIRRTSKDLQVRTDSSARFEKEIDRLAIESALDRVSSLLQQYGQAKIAKDIYTTKKSSYTQKKIQGEISNIKRILGITISPNEVKELLNKIDFSYSSKDDEIYHCLAPSYRNDIETEIDIIEEVARLYGYNNIPYNTPYYSTSHIPHHPLYLMEKRLRDFMLRLGLQELLTCNLISPTQAAIIEEHSAISVMHAKSIEQSVLRPSFLPALLKNIKHNQNFGEFNFSGFEIGKLHFKDNDQFKEKAGLGIILSGNKFHPHWDIKQTTYDFFDLKGFVESLFDLLNLSKYTFVKGNLSSFHPGRQATVHTGNEQIGVIGQVHPKICNDLEIKNNVYYAQLDIEELAKLMPKKVTMTELPQYPSSQRDITLTFDTSIEMQTVLDTLENSKSKILKKVRLIDIYKSDKLGANKMNCTFRITYRDDSKTMDIKQVEKEHEKVTQLLRQKLEAFIYS